MKSKLKRASQRDSHFNHVIFRRDQRDTNDKHTGDTSLSFLYFLVLFNIDNIFPTIKPTLLFHSVVYRLFLCILIHGLTHSERATMTSDSVDCKSYLHSTFYSCICKTCSYYNHRVSKRLY